MTRRIWLGTAAVVVLAAVAAVAVRPGARGAGEGGEEGAALPPVKAPSEVVVDGRVVPVRHASLSFGVAGIVAEVRVAEGARVPADEVLVRLRAERQAAAVARAEAEVRRAEARLAELRAGPRSQDVKRAQAAVAAARAEWLRARRDFRREEDVAVAEAQLRQAEAELELLQAGPRPEAVAAAEADLAAARAALAEARVALAETVLRAPFAGVVAAVLARPGEYVTPGTPVVRLGDASGWLVETEDLTEVDVVRIREGDPVRLRFDALPDLELPGRVVRIRPLGEDRQGDVVYTAVIEPERADPRLRWNMTAEVVIHTGR